MQQLRFVTDFISYAICFIISVKGRTSYIVMPIKIKIKKLIVSSSILLSLFAILLSVFGSGFFGPSRALAAIPNDTQLKKQAESSAECKKQVQNKIGNDEDKKNTLNICVASYVDGYKDTAIKDRKALAGVCEKKGYPAVYLFDCVIGYEKGQKDRKAADSDDAKPPPSGDLSEAQIRNLAKTSPDCEVLKPDSNDATANASYGACVEGYVGGYLGKKTKAQTCSSSALDSFCNKGYDAGKSDKAAGVKTQAQQTANSTAPRDSGADGSTDPDCESSGGFGLAWIMCPLIEGLASVTDFIFDKIVEPMMDDVPVSTKASDPGYKTWQGFRLIANIILIGALLVMVLAQAIGRANVIDAYAIKKMAPRILLGVIAINLSIYITVGAADIVNVVGKGIGSLLTTPFIGAGNFTFNITSGKGFGAFAEMLAANGIVAVGVGAPLATIITGFIVGGATAVLGTLIFSILIPIALISLAILVTLAIRQGLLVFLIICSPVAFALYVLPGTEKYFHKWWELFIKTLLVYPIIAVIFAMSTIMTVTTVNSTSSFVVNGLVALIFTFLPLVLIPFAFRFAGGAMAALYNAANGVRGNLNKDGGWLKTRQGFYRQQNKDSTTRGRSQMARQGAQMASSTNPFTRRLGSYVQRRAHGYTGDIFAAESEMNHRLGKESQESIGSGDDALWRAYTWSGDKEKILV